MSGGNLTICITGGIGAGKSVVSRVLRCNYFKVYDCDTSAKFLMENDLELKQDLEERLGKEIYGEDGKLDRKYLANLIFSDSDKRNFVNRLVHKAVKTDILRKRDKIKGFFFIETAIPTTGNISDFCDDIWLVKAPIKIRLKRVESRDKMSIEEIKERIKAQEKEFIFTNDKKVIVLENDNKTSLLPEILRLADKWEFPKEPYMIIKGIDF